MKQLSRLLLPPTLHVQEEKEEMEKPSTFLVQQKGKWENRATFWKKNKKKKNEKIEHLFDRR
jgi:hypothetical protein